MTSKIFQSYFEPFVAQLAILDHNLEDKHKITCKHCECEHLLKHMDE